MLAANVSNIDINLVRVTVKALLSPGGAYLLFAVLEGGLNREGGLLERGGLL